MATFIPYFFTYCIICLSQFSAQQSVQEIIRRFHLTPLEPEGGYFREIYNTGFDSRNCTTICDVQHSRSHIYYLLKDETSDHRVSTWHKIIGTEETWYHHMGATVTIFTVTKQKENIEYKTVHLGTSRGSRPFFTIPPNTWFAAMVNASDVKAYSLVSCVCEPGFSCANFRMATYESICGDGILLQAWKNNPKLLEYFLPNRNSKNGIGKCMSDN